MRKRHSIARFSQLLFLALFIILFIQTEYRGVDRIPAAVNSIFRADPLVLVSYLLATKRFVWLLFPALLMLAATALLGRFFCGWICPLGTILDLVTARIRKTVPLRILKGSLKYWLLLPTLGAALFNLNLAGLLDPIAILLRALTFAAYPLLGDAVRQSWVSLYRLMGDNRDVLAPGYAVIRDNLLPFREAFYPLAFTSAAIFIFIIWLERFEKRNWCRNLCPLGTLLGLAGRLSPFRRVPEQLCPDCGACREICPTAFNADERDRDGCIDCMACQSQCPSNRVEFRLKGFAGPVAYLPERRFVIGGLLSGFALARLFRFREPTAQARLLRPPGVREEREFLEKCVRCGECMKVCLRSALYPALFQAGVEGMYTPQVIPRLGYCEYNCTLCGQVCPTGAIPDLPREEKQRQVIGKAVLNRSHCLPLARQINCIVCEEHCPIPEKAIRSRSVITENPAGRRVEVKLPYVIDELCNGCGICENVCPLEGKAGIEVFAAQDRTPLNNSQPVPAAPDAGLPY